MGAEYCRFKANSFFPRFDDSGVLPGQGWSVRASNPSKLLRPLISSAEAAPVIAHASRYGADDTTGCQSASIETFSIARAPQGVAHVMAN